MGSQRESVNVSKLRKERDPTKRGLRLMDAK
jgi:hypothetical protein